MGTFSTSEAKKNASKKISVDTTIYVEITGSDINGDGSISKPYASPHKALSYLDGTDIGDCEVTVLIGVGHFTFTESIRIQHPEAHKINIIGAGLKDGLTTKPKDVWYVPTDGVYPGIGATPKYILTARRTAYADAFLATDWEINKSLILQEFKTTLTFLACNGIDIEGVYLKQLDKLALMGDFGDNADGWAHNGINIGWGSTNYETVDPKARIQGGGFNLGPTKQSNEVVIGGFDYAAVKGSGDFNAQIGDLVSVNCADALHLKGGYVHYETLTSVGANYSLEIINNGTIIGGKHRAYGAYSSGFFSNVHGGTQYKLLAVGCLEGIQMYSADVNLRIDFLASKDNAKLMSNMSNSTCEISAYATWTDPSVFETYAVTNSTSGSNSTVLFGYKMTNQNIIDMDWNLPLDIRTHDFNNLIKSFEGPEYIEVGTTAQAKIQYNTTENSIDFVIN